MSIKINSMISNFKFGFVGFVSVLVAGAANAKAQSPSAPGKAGGEDSTMYYVLLSALALGLIGAIFWLLKSKKADKEAVKPLKDKPAGAYNRDPNALDANKEMEWLRKNKKLVGNGAKKPTGASVVRGKDATQPAAEVKSADTQTAKSNGAPTKLPIFSVDRIELARPYAPLPISNDEDLMNAVEQTQDEFEEDEQVRDLALRILQTFKTRNSIEALSQMALYDLSANLRSKAVSVLAEFNHESVFEPILLASADPTREVRAAAARALSKLTFDRADAWTRIFETEETGRIGQAARAAVESGFVEMSFDRLVHQDKKYAYEAFSLMVLLIKSGETDALFQSLETHKNMNVRRAILHVIKVTKDERAVEKLGAMLKQEKFPLELQEEADKTIEEIGFVTA